MDYEYTVFLSYNRRLQVDASGEQSMSAVGEWVHDVLHPYLEQWLVEFVPDARVAFDGKLPQGTRSESGVRDLLQKSRCMLVVFSVPYFSAPWCRAEWHSMLKREKLAGCKGELVVPLVFADGEHFDEEAKQRIQGRDAHFMQPYTTLGAVNKDHVSFPDFKKEIRRLCAQIEVCARNAPPWQSDFRWESPEPLAAELPFSAPSLQS
ncbi:MAG: toll/interleukin-1 receptor domain-containing protein [Planctomycetes bacterium]|nr:toll/interleukin-1 receptor domain-containing protein [Planctomycetota bacterium]